MRKNLLILTMAALLGLPAVSAPLLLEWNAMEQVDDQITLTVEGNSVWVSGAQGQVLIAVSLAGRKVAEYRIDSPSQRVELNLPKGCYVLKVGKVVRKVSVR